MLKFNAYVLRIIPPAGLPRAHGVPAIAPVAALCISEADAFEKAVPVAR